MPRTYERSCKNKRKMHDGLVAKIAAFDMSRKKKVEYEPYLCGFCKRWHIGKRGQTNK